MNKRRKIYIAFIWSSLTFLSCLIACTNSTENENGQNESSTHTSVKTKKDTLSVGTKESDSTQTDTIIEEPDYPYPIQPSKENWQEDIGEVFVMLPDTVFKVNTHGRNFDYYLTHEMKKKLVKHEEISIDNMDCTISMSKNCENSKDDHDMHSICNCIDRHQKQMNIIIGNSGGCGNCVLDVTSKFQLNGWRKKDGSLLFSVSIGDAFFDFDVSNLFILKSLPNGWKDVTKEYADLTLNNFLDPSFYTEKNLEGIDEEMLQKEIANPPLYNDISSIDTVRLLLHEYILYLEFEIFDEDQFKDIHDYIKYDYVNLIWNGETFEKQFGKWED